MCVCEIREIIGSSMPTVSNHLKILKESGIVISKKKDRYINYKLNFEANEKVINDLLIFIKTISSDLINSDREKVLVTDRKNIC